MKRGKVIVVGAGLAGLSAAYELSQQEGIDLHVLEGRSEVGGRACTQNINGQSVDFGGFIVYPWYRRFHELIKALKYTHKLKKIPLANLYYDLEGEGILQDDDALQLPLNERMKLWLKTFPKTLIDHDPSQPHLHFFDDLSVKKYLKKLCLKDKEDFYIKLFDTISQGYCYGPIEEYKMAFAAATMRQNILHGDIHGAAYFPSGTQGFAEKIAKAVEAKGGTFHFNTTVKEVSGNKVTTDQGDFFADAILFAKPMEEVEYTHFVTATVEFEETVLVRNDKDWGACFYRDNPKLKAAILSSINLKELYSNKLDRFVNVNVKISKQKIPLSNEAELFEAILSQLESRFHGAKALRIVKMVDWKQAMPIADEKFVEKLNKKQGKGGHYFAGDFLGCPSMETALMTGKRAAEAIFS